MKVSIRPIFNTGLRTFSPYLFEPGILYFCFLILHTKSEFSENSGLIFENFIALLRSFFYCRVGENSEIGDRESNHEDFEVKFFHCYVRSCKVFTLFSHCFSLLSHGFSRGGLGQEMETNRFPKFQLLIVESQP